MKCANGTPLFGRIAGQHSQFQGCRRIDRSGRHLRCVCNHYPQGAYIQVHTARYCDLELISGHSERRDTGTFKSDDKLVVTGTPRGDLLTHLRPNNVFDLSHNQGSPCQLVPASPCYCHHKVECLEQNSQCSAV
jgi:hypothetical protein